MARTPNTTYDDFIIEQLQIGLTPKQVYRLIERQAQMQELKVPISYRLVLRRAEKWRKHGSKGKLNELARKVKNDGTVIITYIDSNNRTYTAQGSSNENKS